MSTAIDERPVRRPRRGWWLGWELLALVVLAMVSLPFVDAFGSGLRGEVARRAAQVIESATPAEHHSHGHELAGADHIICGVHVFGTEPASPSALADVHTVYGYYFCAVGPRGTPYLESSRSDGPVVVNLVGTPTARIALSGQGYADRVRAMMPDQYESQCFHGLPDASVAADVQRRFIAEVTDAR